MRGKPGDNAGGGFLGGTHSVRPRGKAGRKRRHDMITDGRGNARWPNGAIPQWRQSLVCGRAEPAPPRGARPRGGGLAGKALRLRERRFSRRDALCASARYGRTNGTASRSHRCFYDEPVAGRRQRWGGRYVDITAVRSPPLRGGRGRGEMAYRGRAGDNARGGFLGGARSPRPHCEAVGMPRHNIIIGGKRTPGGQMGTCSGEANSVLAAVRSPPLPRVDDQN